MMLSVPAIGTKKIHLLLVPNELPYQERPNLLPLPLGVLQGYLRSQGFEVNAIDLNMRLIDIAQDTPRETWAPIYAPERVHASLNSGCDSHIAALMDKLLFGLDISPGDFVGISLGADFSWLEMHGGFLLGQRIKERWPGTEVVFGGNNVHYLLQFQQDFRELWDAVLDRFRYIFVGPGEHSFLRLIRSTQGTEPEAVYEELSGAIYRQGPIVAANGRCSATIKNTV